MLSCPGHLRTHRDRAVFRPQIVSVTASRSSEPVTEPHRRAMESTACHGTISTSATGPNAARIAPRAVRPIASQSSRPTKSLRPYFRLWRCRHPAASSNGHTGPADFAALAMAKRICREADRFDPTGLSRPCRCVRRTASPPPAQILPKILQRGSDAPIVAEGRAGAACRSDCRSHASDASSRRIAPPIF